MAKSAAGSMILECSERLTTIRNFDAIVTASQVVLHPNGSLVIEYHGCLQMTSLLLHHELSARRLWSANSSVSHF